MKRVNYLKSISSAFLFMILFASLSIGQVLNADKTTLDFGDTYENLPDSLPVLITNPANFAVHVSSVRKYKMYGANDLTLKDTTFLLGAGSSKQLYIKFAPRHNVSYLSQLVFVDNSNRGCLVIELKGQGKYSQSYYSPTENLSEEALKSAMKTLLAQNYVTLGYNGGRDKMFLIVDNLKVNGQGASVNTIIERYGAKTISGFVTRADAQNFPDGNCTSVCFNTEHTWPQSLFSQNDPMVSDLHHLYVVNEPANSTRSNYPFGNVSTPTWSSGGSKFANGVFEPRDDQKGATARSMLYFPIRYQNYSSFLNSQEAVLRQWHQNYPPNARDIRRNEDIFSVQKNRNPFVDYPQYIERITSISNSSTLVPTYKIDTIGGQVNFGIVQDTAFRTYCYPVVNYSNQTISLTGVSLFKGTSVELVPVTIPSALLPGSKAQIYIRVKWPQSDRSFTDSLLFTWIGSSSQTVNVPVSGTVQFPVLTEMEMEQLSSLPRISSNPNHGSFFMEVGTSEVISIRDALGGLVQHKETKDSTGRRIIIENPTGGLYFVSITNSWKNHILKMVVH